MGLAKRIAIAALLASAAESTNASAFVAWQVADVPWGDVLNVRKYPSSSSQIQSAYPNGTILSMTGKCTGGVDLKDIRGLPHSRQRQMVRYLWCELWHDPAQDGNIRAGWVYGKYIKPN